MDIHTENNTLMGSTKDLETFIQELTAAQSQLYGFVLAQVINQTDAKDVLQKTNLMLWKNHERYDPQRPFLGWAIATAKLQVLSYYRDQKRDRLVFDDQLVNQLQELAELRVKGLSKRQEALQFCLADLSSMHRRVLTLSYVQGESHAAIAEISGRSVVSVTSLMARLRRALRRCISLRLDGDGKEVMT